MKTDVCDICERKLDFDWMNIDDTMFDQTGGYYSHKKLEVCKQCRTKLWTAINQIRKENELMLYRPD